MPNSLTPPTSTVVNSVDQTQNNTATNNAGNLADKFSLKSSAQNPAVRAPTTQDTAPGITKNQTFPATIESVDTTTLPRADSVTEDTPTEDKLSPQAKRYGKIKEIYKDIKEEYNAVKKDLASFKKLPRHLTADKFREHLDLQSSKEEEEKLLGKLFHSFEICILHSSDYYGNHRPDTDELQHIASLARESYKYLEAISQQHSSEETIPEIAYRIAELNSLAYENVANIIQEKFIEANAIKETPNKKNADQHWQLLKRIVLGGKSMGRNYLPERLASRLSGKMSYVFQKGFREWLLSNQKDATAAAEFFPSNEEGEAFFEKRKSLINEEHYFSFLKNSNFLEWMHSEYLPDRLCFSDNYKPDIDEIEQALCNYFGIKGITHLTAEQRSPLEVKAQRKGFFDISGKIFSTEKMSIGENEAGWAAYVLSPQNKLYIHSHIPGKFHHSSFLSGLPVQAAGTIKINSKGKLIAITPKSGHYRSTPEMFAKILDSLHKRGVELRCVAAQPDIFSPDYYDAYEIMLAGGVALESMSKINI